MYGNSLGMMSNVLNTDPVLSVRKTTGVPNVNIVPNIPKIANNNPSVPKKTTKCTNWCSVPSGVPNVKFTKVHQVYQNSLGMMPSVLNTDYILSVPNATGVPNVTTVPSVPKMTMNDPSLPKSYLLYQQKIVYQALWKT